MLHLRARLPIVLFVCAGAIACKPSLRDPKWTPKPTERMLAWFKSLNYSGFKGTKPYVLDYPDWYMNLNVEKPPLTYEAVELGRYLFYDKALSADGSVACASCHQQKFSFADNRQFSVGVKGRLGRRNAMHLVNLVSDKRFFWDGRAESLEAQVLMPIEDNNEMDLPLEELIHRLAKHPVYAALFERAYNTKVITKDLVADALAQFVKSIISYSSPDDYMRAVDVRRIQHSEIPAEMRKYWPLYKKNTSILNCGPCHTTSAGYGQNQFEDVGLEADPKDVGYYVVTKEEKDKGKFKVPTTRNMGVTAPYMHDGRFSTIEVVIDHYRRGMVRKKNISPLYLDKDKKIKSTMLTDAEVAVMLEGIPLYTDEKMLADPKYADPF